MEGEKLCFLRAGTTGGEDSRPSAPEMWGEAGRRAVAQGLSQMHCSVSGVCLGQWLKAGPSYQLGKHFFSSGSQWGLGGCFVSQVHLATFRNLLGYDGGGGDVIVI